MTFHNFRNLAITSEINSAIRQYISHIITTKPYSQLPVFVEAAQFLCSLENATNFLGGCFLSLAGPGPGHCAVLAMGLFTSVGIIPNWGPAQ